MYLFRLGARLDYGCMVNLICWRETYLAIGDIVIFSTFSCFHVRPPPLRLQPFPSTSLPYSIAPRPSLPSTPPPAFSLLNPAIGPVSSPMDPGEEYDRQMNLSAF